MQGKRRREKVLALDTTERTERAAIGELFGPNIQTGRGCTLPKIQDRIERALTTHQVLLAWGGSIGLEVLYSRTKTTYGESLLARGYIRGW
jgi:hypothetical protein